MKLYFCFLFSAILLACGGVSDYSEDLGNGFTYESSGANLKNIRTPISGQRNIYGKVTKYKYDQNFILVTQQPDKEIYQGSIAFELRNANREKYKLNSEDDMIESERVADSLIQNDLYYKKLFTNKLNYWIVSHKHKKMYGPLTKIEYVAKRKELKVPDDLKLEEENQ
jgi:hypothetical protein